MQEGGTNGLQEFQLKLVRSGRYSCTLECEFLPADISYLGHTLACKKVARCRRSHKPQSVHLAAFSSRWSLRSDHGLEATASGCLSINGHSASV